MSAKLQKLFASLAVFAALVQPLAPPVKTLNSILLRSVPGVARLSPCLRNRR